MLKAMLQQASGAEEDEDELESVGSQHETGGSAARELVCVTSLQVLHYSMFCLQRSRTAELLACRLSHSPRLHLQPRQHPVSLEDRLDEARTLIDRELDDLTSLRADLTHFNDVLVQHTLVLRSLRNNYLHQ